MPTYQTNCTHCDRLVEGRANVRLDHHHNVCCERCYGRYSRQCDTCMSTFAASGCCQNCGERNLCTFCHEYHDGSETVCDSCESRTSICQCCERRRLTSRIEDGWCRPCRSADTWENRGFHDPNPTYRRTKSGRKYGIEIETHRDHNYRQLRPLTSFGCTVDGSTDGKEFVSPVLYGDGGLDELNTVTRFARENNWEVNSACGLHLHCDVSEESVDNLRKLVFAYHYTYDFWTSLISDARKRNYYCAKHRWNPTSVMSTLDFAHWVELHANERYTWCNWRAYLRHKTVELRFHSATLSANKITKFIKANLRFIDWVCSLCMSDVHNLLGGVDTGRQFEVISECWGPSVSSFYKQRAESFGKPLTPTPLVGAS